MSLKATATDGVYTVAGGKLVPSWLSEKKKKSLRKDEEYNRRVELVQDFEFPAACQKIKISPDGNFIFATGYHPPRVRVYDLSQLSMKFERHLDSEIVDFQILSEDYSKAVFLCADRTLNIHAKFGGYYKTRIPKFGRDLAYCPFTAELLVAASAPEVYRLNLSEGRFMNPLVTQSPAVNACAISPAHGMLACAGEDGGLECFDVRQRESLGYLNAAGAMGVSGQQLTAIRFDDGGMHVAVGTSEGLVGLFDLRSQRPMVVKDHMYDCQIVDIKFHQGGSGPANTSTNQVVISADKRIIKVWDASSGDAYTSIEPPEDINDVCIDKGSGLILAACDTSRIQAYFVPSLGPAPRWCSFLENLTEELEENINPTVYDDYRFVSRDDLDKLGLTHLIGTSLLKAYMHGFFIDHRVYQKAKSIADPFAYDAYKAKRIAEKMEEERKSRISIVRKLPKVNATLAARVLVDEATEAAANAADDEGEEGDQELQRASKKSRKGGKPLPNLLEDNRFKAMFENPEFAIDESSFDYRVLHPNTDPSKERQLLAEHFDPVNIPWANDDEDSDVEREERKRLKNPKLLDEQQQQMQQQREPIMYAARDDVAAAAFHQGRSLRAEKDMPLGARAASDGGQRVLSHVGGSRELSFIPRMAPDGQHNNNRGGGRGGRSDRGSDSSRGHGRRGGGGSRGGVGRAGGRGNSGRGGGRSSSRGRGRGGRR